MENRFYAIYRRWWFLCAALAFAFSLWLFAQVLALPLRDMAYQLVVLNTARQQRVEGFCRQLAPDCQSVSFERHLLTTHLRDQPHRWLGGQTVIRMISKASTRALAQERLLDLIGPDLEPLVRVETVPAFGGRP